MTKLSASWRQVFLSVLLALGLTTVGVSADAADPPGLRVMTYNVLYATAQSPAGAWPDRRKIGVVLIRRWRPDLVGLQEPTAEQVRELADALPEYEVLAGPLTGPSRTYAWAALFSPFLLFFWAVLRWRARASGRPRRWRIAAWFCLLAAVTPLTGAAVSYAMAGFRIDPGEQCAILYRRDRFRLIGHGAYWLSERPERPGSVMAGTWLPRVANWVRREALPGGEPLRFTNTHFDYANPWARARAAALLRTRLDRAWVGELQLLVGDLNEPRDGRSVQILLRPSRSNAGPPAFSDAWNVAGRRVGPSYSLHGGHGRYRWPGRIDHVLFRPPCPVRLAVRITDYAGEVYPSDHYPVLAELRWPLK